MPLPQSKHAPRSGQSLIEAIVAISILTLGFLGIASLLSRSLLITKVLSDQEKATYLAAEGVELAKNLLDHDIYMHLAGLGPGWGSCWNGINTTLALGTNHTELDYASTDCSKSFTGGGDFLWFDPVTRLYSYISTGPDNPVRTNFKREVRIQVTNGRPDITVNAIVTWSTGLYTAQSINLEDHFYNWRP